MQRDTYRDWKAKNMTCSDAKHKLVQVLKVLAYRNSIQKCPFMAMKNFFMNFYKQYN